SRLPARRNRRPLPSHSVGCPRPECRDVPYRDRRECDCRLCQLARRRARFPGRCGHYAVALAVVGLALHWRARAALLKGGVMGMFGLWVAGSTIYSALTATMPKAEVMGAIGLLALAVNLGVAGLLYRYRAADSQALSVWLC